MSLNLKWIVMALGLGLLLGNAGLCAEQNQKLSKEASLVIPLWPEQKAEAGRPEVKEMVQDIGHPGAPDRRYRNITQPQLEVFRAGHPSKYRLPNTTAFRFGLEIPLQDAQCALRLARSRTAEPESERK